MHPDDVIRGLGELQQRLFADREALERDFPHIVMGDARRGAFVRMRAFANAAKLQAVLRSRLLEPGAWRIEPGAGNVPAHVHRKHAAEFIGQYDKSLIFSLFYGSFSMFETTLRILLREVKPGACNDAGDAFGNVYGCLLAQLDDAPPDAKQLLDLLREVRNTVHNNGHYWPKRDGDKTLTYKGKAYQFVDGAELEFTGWPFWLWSLSELRVLLVAIMRDPVVSGIDEPIPSPFGGGG